MESIEEKYRFEFSLLKNRGRLVGGWANVYEHCKKEGEVALCMSALLSLNGKDRDLLTRGAILHDWYKKTEVKRMKEEGPDSLAATNEESKLGLLEMGVEEQVVEIAHSVGCGVLHEVESFGLLRKTMHFIDDICMGAEVVEIDERIDKLEASPEYRELNERDRKDFGGRTAFQVQREVGKKIQADLEDICKIEKGDLVRKIKSALEAF